MLSDEYELECDAPLAAMSLYNCVKGDLYGYMQQSSHARRLSKFGVEEDIRFCLEEDKYTVIPVLEGDELVQLNA